MSDEADYDDDYDDDYGDRETCERCGGEGLIEYDDAPEVWYGDSPDLINHLVECPTCRGSGVRRIHKWR